MQSFPDDKLNQPCVCTVPDVKAASEAGRGRENNGIPKFLTSSPHRRWLFGLCLVVATIIAYHPAWHGRPVWDDESHLTPPQLRSVEGLERIWLQPGATHQYYPLVFSLFWVEYRLWGYTTFGYHLVNILTHAFSAILLWKILRRLEVPGAHWAAVIFALHPVCVESVAWMSEIKNCLSGLFYLGAALIYLRFDRTRDARFYFVALGLLLLGLASKTVIATLPPALLVVFWWQRGKLSWKQDVLPLIPFFVAGICAGLFTAWMERTFVGARGSDFNFSIVDRVLIAGRVVWFYLGKLVWPVDLTFIYPHWNVSPAVWWQYSFPALALLVTIGLWLLSKWNRGPLAAWLFFVGTLFPVLGFLNVYPFRYSFVADHFQYLAMIGPTTLAAAGIAKLFGTAIKRPPLLDVAFCGALLFMLGVLTWRQAGVYRNKDTLWHDTLAKNPDCCLALNDLGVILKDQGHIKEAMENFRKVIRIDPEFAESLENMGDILAHRGDFGEAIADFRKAIQITPNNVGVLDYLAWLLATTPDARLRNGTEAVQLAEHACDLTHYRDPASITTLAAAFAEVGRFDDAMAASQKAQDMALALRQQAVAAQAQKLTRCFENRQPYREQSVKPATSKSPPNPDQDK